MDMTNIPKNNPFPKKLSPAARRALSEAAQRRKAHAENEAKNRTGDMGRPIEKAGPKGAEPTRFGDWERSGIAYDF